MSPVQLGTPLYRPCSAHVYSHVRQTLCAASDGCKAAITESSGGASGSKIWATSSALHRESSGTLLTLSLFT